MNWNELSKQAHGNAVEKGFWLDKPSCEHCLMLVVTEISEMVEADRASRHADMARYKAESGRFFDCELFRTYIKDTVEDECADTAIRILDLAGALSVDFTHVKETNYYREFRRFRFTDNAFALVKGLAKGNISIIKRIAFALQYIEDWSHELGFDLEQHIKLKMQYNATRSFRHGKKY